MASSRPRLAVVVGARPNFMKAAPLLNYWKKREVFDVVFLHTGQHYDSVMTTDALKDLGAPGFDVVLEVPKAASSIRYSALLRNLKSYFSEEEFDGVVVFGDVNSTVAATLAASHFRLPVIHVESGLRSHDVSMPEEINRIIVDNYSDLLLCTEQAAVENLKLEGVHPNKIKLVGNLMIESLITFHQRRVKAGRNLIGKDYILTTFHRAENVFTRANLLAYVNLLVELSSSIAVVFPVHPSTRNELLKHDLWRRLESANVYLMPPQGYGDFYNLMEFSSLILTDSGGIQEEAVFLNKRLVTLRANTERPCTVATGLNLLCPISEVSSVVIFEHMNQVDEAVTGIPLWDASVSKRVSDEIEKFIK